VSTKINLGAGLEHIHVTERWILERVFANLKRPIGRPFWTAVHRATSYGSNVSAALCREFGYDPETGKRIEVSE
jgi:hypothetical protein